MTIVDPTDDLHRRDGRDRTRCDRSYPFTFLEGDTTIGAGAEVGPQARIVDSEIGDGANGDFRRRAWVSTSARRPSLVRSPRCGRDTNSGEGLELGTFVETKNTTHR